jgi:hypothetical protein
MTTVAEKLKMATPRGEAAPQSNTAACLSARQSVRQSPLNCDAARTFSVVEDQWKPQTMYLQTINKSADSVRKTITGRKTNNVSDIEGACPKPSRGNRLFTSNGAPKPVPISRSLYTSDIFGAQTRPPKVRKSRNGMPSPNYSLDVSDIEGASSKPKRFVSKRCVDPLSPDYKLPSFEVDLFPEVENTRFLRDQHDVSDIDGARPRITRTWEPRDFYNVTDIEGAHPTWKPFNKRNMVARGGPGEPPLENDAMNVSDINGGGKFKTTRQIDPLSPQYRIHEMDIVDESPIKPGGGRKMSDRRSPGRKEPYFALHTQDIEGAQADTAGGNINRIGTLAPKNATPPNTVRSSRGSKSARRRASSSAAEAVNIPFIPTGAPRQRKDFRRTNLTQDIPGAQHDTLSRGLKSKRQTDPLNPKYQSLDRSGSIRGNATVGRAKETPLPHAPESNTPWSKPTSSIPTERKSSVDRNVVNGTSRGTSTEDGDVVGGGGGKVVSARTPGSSGRVTPKSTNRGTNTRSERRVHTSRQSVEAQRQRKADIQAVKALPA